jgi:hypothetical protein
MNDDHLERAGGIVSLHTKQLLESISFAYKLPITTLVAIAIEHELQRDKPFDYDVSLPKDEYLEFSFVDEAGKILDFMRKFAGLSLEQMCLNRHDMGIPDHDRFMLGFRECLVNQMLETYTPKTSSFSKFKYPDDKVFYRVKGSGKPMAKKIRKDANDFEKFQKLKKKFKNE